MTHSLGVNSLFADFLSELADSGSELANYLFEIADSGSQINNSGGAPQKLFYDFFHVTSRF